MIHKNGIEQRLRDVPWLHEGSWRDLNRVRPLRASWRRQSGGSGSNSEIN